MIGDIDHEVSYEPVASSNVHSIGYRVSDHSLFVWFKNDAGAVTHRVIYYDVPSHVYLGLRTAASKGKFLDANVKKAGFKFSYF
ncbi:Uncharacterized protein OS=Porphyromonas gingivalis F0185 GN=HMPREF1988_00354 PE=4 SV=1: KTSC [Gemmataceae bacterium]|nr:Uncharacterized protein OS=Porphyromonas gingivalis F0185 GN=HMPREF1988_00354 PE=4 SV=1: KTSC [Gemmataceae bacterium]VTT98951.1 Uncharacterized protein OS=Porphyromonas gingivalis F0185 GN=HMPREF1988_00354 PE=4 SV=1: KTSC [Gemmataceae bacterium]